MAHDVDEPRSPDRADAAAEPAIPEMRGRAGAPRAPLDAAARARIGRGLRLHYAEVLSLPIPERLRALIDDLATDLDREASR